MCYEQILQVDCVKKKTFWICIELRKLRQSNIVPPPSTTTKTINNNLKLYYKKYRQIHTRWLPALHFPSLHIPCELWTPHGEKVIY